MGPEIITRAAFTVVGLKYRGTNQKGEIPHLWRELSLRQKEIRNKKSYDVAYGIMGNYDLQSGEFDYLASYEVDKGEVIPPGMESWDVPAQTYAVFKCTLATIMESYNYANNEWLPNSGYRRGDGPEFEEYGADFSPDVEGSEYNICLPIVVA